VQIVGMSNFPEQRLKMLEESAFKEKREIETRKNAEDLHKYLDFADLDWKNLNADEFELIRFNRSPVGKASAKTAIAHEEQPSFSRAGEDESFLSRRYNRNFNSFRSVPPPF
jgi:hypothetical protein